MCTAVDIAVMRFIDKILNQNRTVTGEAQTYVHLNGLNLQAPRVPISITNETDSESLLYEEAYRLRTPHTRKCHSSPAIK